jgi:heat shock protein HtpX
MLNHIRTVLLLGLLTGLFMLIGSALGGTGGMVIAFGIAVLMNFGAWWFSDKLALSMSGARETSPEALPELHHMIEGLARNAGIPKPRVYLIDSPMPNAFATGRSPDNSAVAATTGLLGMLSPSELAGVMAHELAHIKNRDTLISSLAATLAGAIGMLADMATWALIFGGFGGSDEEEGGGIGDLIGGFLMLFLAPIMALLIQMAISRGREFVADAEGARILDDPIPLARALAKIENWKNVSVEAGYEADVRPASAHQYIINPLHGGLMGLFSTHPSTEERIERLYALAQQGGRVAVR